MITNGMLGVAIALALAQGGAEPVVVEQGIAQLFVDDYLIAQQYDLERTLHQPVKENGGNEPVINLPSNAFGEYSFTLEANGSVVYDARDKTFVLYAIGFSSEMGQDKERAWQRVRLYRFTSPDALSWSEGEWVYPRSPDDFLDPESKQRASNMDMFSCYYDVQERHYPYKGLMWFANWGDEREGSYLVRSKDGRHWERQAKVFEGFANANDLSARRIQQDGRDLAGAGDVTLFTYDSQTKKFLALIKFYSVKPVEFDNRLRSRAYAWLDRLNAPFDLQRIERVELVPPAAEKNGDMPHDEYYASTAWRYGAMWLGGLKIWHGGGDYSYSSAGGAFMKLVSSHDGIHWQKVPFKNDSGIPEVWLANGTEGGNGGKNDGGYMTEFSTGPFVSADELVYYYACSSWGKNQPTGVRITGGGIFRARLRIDGFVSVDAGTLTTKLLSFKGKHLTLNSTRSVRVDVLSPEGKELGTTTVKGDSLAHDVYFEGRDLAALAEQGTCKLRFQPLDGGRLYSFAIR